MPMVGSQYNSKLYIKNGAMLYIKVLLWTPAECMQRGSMKRREKKTGGRGEGGWCPTTLIKYCCFPKMSDVQNLKPPRCWSAVQQAFQSSPSTDSGVRHSKVTSPGYFLCQHAASRTLLTLPARSGFRFRGERRKPPGGRRSVGACCVSWVSSSCSGGLVCNTSI